MRPRPDALLQFLIGAAFCQPCTPVANCRLPIRAFFKEDVGGQATARGRAGPGTSRVPEGRRNGVPCAVGLD